MNHFVLYFHIKTDNFSVRTIRIFLHLLIFRFMSCFIECVVHLQHFVCEATCSCKIKFASLNAPSFFQTRSWQHIIQLDNLGHGFLVGCRVFQQDHELFIKFVVSENESSCIWVCKQRLPSLVTEYLNSQIPTSITLKWKINLFLMKYIIVRA